MKVLELICSYRSILSALAVALLPLGGHAATLSATLSGPTNLSTGASGALVLTWDDSSPARYTSFASTAQITVNGAIVETFSLQPAGGTFSFDLDLPTPGTYEIAATGSISYFETMQTIVSWQTYGYSCGSYFNRRTCYSSYPIYGYQTYDRGSFALNETISINVAQAPVTSPTAAASPVPLPAAAPLLGAGLAILGFFGWRRRWTS